MELKQGDRVIAESESTERAARHGVIREVRRSQPNPCYLIGWDDGHESIYTPAAGALARETSEPRAPTNA
jgi:Domain of unknown function (DUF1918)